MPSINKPSNHFDVRARAGNGVSPSAVVTDLNFTPNLVWTKQRDAINYHIIADNISRSNVAAFLSSNATDADNTASGGGWFQSFDTNGYTTRAGSSDSANVNKSGVTYVDWVWKAGGTAVTNTTGTISAQVSANPTAGFSIVSYTGTGANATVGHGLGVAPQMIIVKCRSNASTNFTVYHTSIGNTGYIYLNLTNLAVTGYSGFWNNTSPTSSVFSLGSDVDGYVNGSGRTNVAYCFAAVAGYSAFGSYTGNGSADGPFVYTGFRPKFLMLKKTSNATNSNWLMQDTSRETYNASNYATLAANLTNLEPQVSAGSFEGNFIDYLSNGFKIRSSGSNSNESSSNYIYMAFAEAPFKYAGAR
jgi:hypothetical protein